MVSISSAAVWPFDFFEKANETYNHIFYFFDLYIDKEGAAQFDRVHVEFLTKSQRREARSKIIPIVPVSILYLATNTAN